MIKRKKILFITYENPFDRDNGDRIYTCNFLDALIDLNCDINIIGYDNQNSKRDNNHHNVKIPQDINFTLIPFKQVSKLKLIFSLLPGMIVNRKRKSFVNLVESHLKENKYNYIFINHQKMVFSLLPIIKLNLLSKLIFISHNAEYLLSLNNAKNSRKIVERLIYLQDAFKTKLYEKKWLNHFDIITTISEHDKDYYILNFKNPITKVIRPIMKGINSISENKKKINEIILVGSFHWGPKKENLLSFLNSKNFKQLYANNINLTIVGNADPLLVKKINSKYKGVFMTGRVESVDSYYSNAKIAIVPEVLGGGFKLKVAEAAFQKTAIFSVKGAITKCNLEKDKHFIESTDFEELINKVIEYQNKKIEIDAMIKRAFKIAKHDFSKTKFKSDILKILSN